nr:PREDICTED: uncharacterized protein LOC108227448 isoform X2 [Daucus carota subsp. sativus]
MALHGFYCFEAVEPVWAPYYTIHKIMAGLLDQYLYAKSSRALKMVKWMTQYFYNRVQNVMLKYSIEQHYRSLYEATGGMNDVLYNLYSITNDPKHLLAHLFDKPCFLGLLAVQADDLSGFHANTHIPIVVGSQRRYEVTGDPLYKGLGQRSTINLRIPSWTHSNGMKAALNGQGLSLPNPGNLLKISRKWNNDDKIVVEHLSYLLVSEQNQSKMIGLNMLPIMQYCMVHIFFHYLNQNSIRMETLLNQTTTLIEWRHYLNQAQSIPSTQHSGSFQKTPRPQKYQKVRDYIGKSVMLEPFDLPGMVLVHGNDARLGISHSSDSNASGFRNWLLDLI